MCKMTMFVYSIVKCTRVQLGVGLPIAIDTKTHCVPMERGGRDWTCFVCATRICAKLLVICAGQTTWRRSSTFFQIACHVPRAWKDDSLQDIENFPYRAMETRACSTSKCGYLCSTAILGARCKGDIRGPFLLGMYRNEDTSGFGSEDVAGASAVLCTFVESRYGERQK